MARADRDKAPVPRSRADRTAGDGPGCIVVAIDDSPSARRAASYAAGLTRCSRSRLLLLHVRRFYVPANWTRMIDQPWGFGDPVDRSLDDDVLAGTDPRANDGVKFLDHLAEMLRADYGVLTETVVRDGTSAYEITQVARLCHADAIVGGGSSSFAHRIAGSVASRLLRAGTWPVTVVP